MRYLVAFVLSASLGCERSVLLLSQTYWFHFQMTIEWKSRWSESTAPSVIPFCTRPVSYSADASAERHPSFDPLYKSVCGIPYVLGTKCLQMTCGLFTEIIILIVILPFVTCTSIKCSVSLFGLLVNCVMHLCSVFGLEIFICMSSFLRGLLRNWKKRTFSPQTQLIRVQQTPRPRVTRPGCKLWTRLLSFPLFLPFHQKPL